MEAVSKNYKPKTLSYTDDFGTHIVISKGKENSLNFTLHHGEIVEGSARKDYEGMSLCIPPESGTVYQLAEGIYEKIGDQFVSSGDPIRDGRNFFYLEQNESNYYLTIGRDLANELNQSCQTKVSLVDDYYGKLYEDVVSGRYATTPTEGIYVKKYS